MTGYRLKRDTVDIAPIASTGTITSVSRPHTGHTETMNLEARKWLPFSLTGSTVIRIQLHTLQKSYIGMGKSTSGGGNATTLNINLSSSRRNFARERSDEDKNRLAIKLLLYQNSHSGSHYSSGQAGESGGSCVHGSSGVPVGVVEGRVEDHGVHHTPSRNTQQQNTAQQQVPTTTNAVSRSGNFGN